MTVYVALAQINSVVGDMPRNIATLERVARDAAGRGADIVLTPELSLVGYPPEDLLLRSEFVHRAEQALLELAGRLADLKNVHVIVGHPQRIGARLFNAASILLEGRIVECYTKQVLPNDAVFDEKRYFSAGAEPCVFDVKGVRFGINICEDTWSAGPPAAAQAAGAQVLLVPNGSPYHTRKQQVRYDVIRRYVTSHKMAVVYVNLIGGQDELVFDGNSFVMTGDGDVVCRLAHVEEDIEIVAFEGSVPQSVITQPHRAALSVEAEIYQVLVQGLRDYIQKNRFPGVLLGLSGGVDSALTLAIAVDALGAEKVRAVMMPSAYTADISLHDSREMIARLGVRYDELAIEGCFSAFATSLAADFSGLPADSTEENLQARIRGTLLMALSNKFGQLVVTTGNKSEMAVGYCTLYGDMAGGFAVLKDVAKTLVYRLCAYRNSIGDIIPQRILTRAPSAELRADQTDQDSLPAYEILDAIMQQFVEENRSVQDIVAAGYLPADVERVTRLIKLNEYKRRQSAIGTRITQRAFGRDWRMPVTSCYIERIEDIKDSE